MAGPCLSVASLCCGPLKLAVLVYPSSLLCCFIEAGVPYEALHNSKKYKKQIEMALARFVMPELDSPVGCLRAR